MVATLKSLKLHGMTDAISTLSEQASPAYQFCALLKPDKQHRVKIDATGSTPFYEPFIIS
jgi:hypothetical protein|tara:strand:- start:46 stop:225 length:180 start_codon:yes stop_codon:yes gene_type:complete